MLVTASLFTVCSLKEQSWAGRRKGMVFVSLQRNCLGSCQSFFRLFKLGRAPSIGNGCETTTLRNSLWIFLGFFFLFFFLHYLGAQCIVGMYLNPYACIWIRNAYAYKKLQNKINLYALVAHSYSGSLEWTHHSTEYISWVTLIYKFSQTIHIIPAFLQRKQDLSFRPS